MARSWGVESKSGSYRDDIVDKLGKDQYKALELLNTDRPQAIGPVDVVLFTVKLYDVETAAATLSPLMGPNTVVITLQNGVDAMDMVAKHVGADNRLAGDDPKVPVNGPTLDN